jgi:hypothetical protein
VKKKMQQNVHYYNNPRNMLVLMQKFSSSFISVISVVKKSRAQRSNNARLHSLPFITLPCIAKSFCLLPEKNKNQKIKSPAKLFANANTKTARAAEKKKGPPKIHHHQIKKCTSCIRPAVTP